ncbi:MAG: hypothetical protein PHT91_02500 [Candidatus Nanoarchaeia archaeon]|nr:hypothetical protein [Candidatus Nanoarchaeia archaeon]MDD5053907.1 hypothetical protein [Candidatus Nanoarchaeia archaeon]MDD5499722.1 hypothetical protein [Candidatus Nanoarchaeia archaeon]
MRIADLLKYYNNEEILSQIMGEAKDREVAIMFSKGFFGQRPGAIIYKNDIIDAVRAGALSFHMSVERWSNPMSLNSTNTKQEMDDLRVGWDLIIDIDTKFFEYAKVCAKLLCHAFEYHGIRNYGLKFSGGSGFHLAIPYESFPKKINDESVIKLFPEAAKKIADYLKAFIRKKLKEMILEMNSIEQIIEKSGKSEKELFEGPEFNPYSVVEIDAAALSSRHLIRMPYSINEKKGLVSLPIKKDELDDFDSLKALPWNIEKVIPFIDREKSDPFEANDLFMQSFDFFKRINESPAPNIKKSINYKKRDYERIPPEKYPPCIKLILKGLQDGKKRALFILINYFKSAKYSKEEIDGIIDEWNKKNPEPLKDSYIKTQIKWNLKSTEYLAPNCDNLMYYSDLGVCKKDSICEIIKNPINYHFKVYTPKKKPDLKTKKQAKKES